MSPALVPRSLARAVVVALVASCALAACGGGDNPSAAAVAPHGAADPSVSTRLATAFGSAGRATGAVPAQATNTLADGDVGALMQPSALAEASGSAWTGPFRPRPIAWAPCPENAALECGTLELPADYKKPHGARFQMAVLRARATDPSRRIGVLVANPGGPGGSGVNFVLGGVAAQAPVITRLRQHFDLIGFDSRGVERSTRVRCPNPIDEPPAGADDATVATFLDDAARRFTAACAAASGEFLFTLSMNNIARDIEMLRRSLGEAQISYAGVSYGTLLGATYASMFPNRVRAAVLDAGVAPDTEGDALMDFWVGHTAGFEFAFQRLDQRCRQDAGCALQRDGVVATYDTVYARLKAQPVKTDSGVITHLMLSAVVGGSLYNEFLWPSIAQALHNARAGDFALLMQLAAGGGGQRDGFGAMLPTLCGTYATRLPAAQVLATDGTATAAYPRFIARVPRAPLAERFQTAFGVALCSAWPASEASPIRNLRGLLAHPPLVIAGDFDNATPAAWSRRLAKALGWPDAVLRYQGGGHAVATSGNRCTDDAIIEYLVNLELPAPGATCKALPLDFGSAAIAAAAARLAAPSGPYRFEPARPPLNWGPAAPAR